MSWGAFLGALGNSTINTMEKLDEQDIRRLQKERLRTQVQEEEGLRTALKETPRVEHTGGEAVGSVVDKSMGFYDDQQREQLKTALGGMTPEQQQAALRSYAPVAQNPEQDLSNVAVYQNPQGQALATDRYKEISETERHSRVAQRLSAEGNISGMEKALQMKSLVRQNELQDKFDKWRDGLQKEQGRLRTSIMENGISSIPKEINPDLAKHGMKAEFVKNGGMGAIVVKQGKNVVFTGSDPDEILGAVTREKINLFSQELLSMMGDMGQVVSFLQAQMSAGQKNRELDIKAGDAASSAKYREAVANHYKEERAFKRQVHEEGAPQRQAALNYTTAQTEALSKSGPPIGEVNGVSVFNNPKGVGAIYADGTPVAADARVSPTPPYNAQLEQAAGLEKAILDEGVVNPKTQKPYTPAEAKAYAIQVSRGRNEKEIDLIGRAISADPSLLTDSKKMNQALTNMGLRPYEPSMTQQKLDMLDKNGGAKNVNKTAIVRQPKLTTVPEMEERLSELQSHLSNKSLTPAQRSSFKREYDQLERKIRGATPRVGPRVFERMDRD
jgi:hypothetical protein